MMTGSTPSISEFDPRPIPFQAKLIKLIRKDLDYEKGVQEILCSGSVGSSKSLIAAHIGITHCIFNERAHLLIGRETMPSLRDTLIQKIIEHLGLDVSYSFNKSRGIIEFANGSKITPFSWADGNYKKVRSYEASAAIIEELTENKNMDFYHEIKMRVGRLSHVKEKFVLSITNPDDPSHEAYKYFIAQPKSNIHVLYSKTSDNPFLPKSYIEMLEETLDPKLKERMLEGKWISLSQEGVYYSYEKESNFINKDYVVDPSSPIHISWDFNIGAGKPLSVVLFQYINGTFHFFDEVIIEGARTEDSLEELYGRRYFDINTSFKIHGDATGRARSTSSRHSDWDIIKNWLSNIKNKHGHNIKFEMQVPISNPKVRDRHNIVNGQLHNSKGQRKVLLYRKAITLDEGFRLTKLKDRAGYIEDDSKHYQHCTTAAGYGIVWCLQETTKKTITVLR